MEDTKVSTDTKVYATVRSAQDQASQVASAPHDFLEKSLIARVHKGNLSWDMVVCTSANQEIRSTILLWPVPNPGDIFWPARSQYQTR
jgi:hypothetical protein